MIKIHFITFRGDYISRQLGWTTLEISAPRCALMCYPSSNITYCIACLLCIGVILLNKFNSIQGLLHFAKRVLHFALLDFITSCVKVITFHVVITSCVNGITSRGDYYILRQYYILRRNSRAW